MVAWMFVVALLIWILAEKPERERISNALRELAGALLAVGKGVACRGKR